MRELANENADSAIDSFARRNQAEHSNAQLKMAGFVGVLGAVSLVFVSQFIPTIGVVGGVVALIAAACIGFRSFAHAAKLRPNDVAPATDQSAE